MGGEGYIARLESRTCTTRFSAFGDQLKNLSAFGGSQPGAAVPHEEDHSRGRLCHMKRITAEGGRRGRLCHINARARLIEVARAPHRC